MKFYFFETDVDRTEFITDLENTAPIFISFIWIKMVIHSSVRPCAGPTVTHSFHKIQKLWELHRTNFYIRDRRQNSFCATARKSLGKKYGFENPLNL
jgi:hypothetical protein